MIKKIKASKSEKIIFFFLISLAIFSLSSFFLIKNKCLFVKNYNPEKLSFDKPNNIAILNVECGNVIIELYPNISPNAVERFKTLVRSKAYDDVAFHRVIKDSLVQAQKYNTEDSQFFITLKDEPLYESEYTPIGKVIYGIEALEKIKYQNKSEYVLRPDFINSIKMLVD